ncbi:hypothetical protein BLNAU_21099 [Blattamonas nauphoetae]|uniref:Uncharacterized protein n=1 Tax=Blattamonas nauphoetae TaxID=2049346 RepID=A0ABQ9WXB5_9EUKA|nr:hypothetical protein BLNAU_21099 [Blattamonas nauphoetae]
MERSGENDDEEKRKRSQVQLYQTLLEDTALLMGRTMQQRDGIASMESSLIDKPMHFSGKWRTRKRRFDAVGHKNESRNCSYLVANKRTAPSKVGLPLAQKTGLPLVKTRTARSTTHRGRHSRRDTGGSATKKCVFSLLHPSSDIRATLPTSLTCRQNAFSLLVRSRADNCVSLRGVEVESSQWRNRLYRSHLLFLEEETYCDIRNQKCLPGHISQIS